MFLLTHMQSRPPYKLVTPERARDTAPSQSHAYRQLHQPLLRPIGVSTLAALYWLTEWKHTKRLALTSPRALLLTNRCSLAHSLMMAERGEWMTMVDDRGSRM